MDYMEFSEDLAADTDPTNPGPHFDELDDGEEAVLVPGSAACSHVM
jgi:hypothetical protein